MTDQERDDAERKRDEIECERRQEILNDFVEKLGETFDNVIIFANSYDGKKKGTRGMLARHGNIFAIQGQVESWIDMPIVQLGDEDE